MKIKGIRFAKVLRARTRFVSPIEFDVNVTPFPETYWTVKEREKLEQDDPYGLEKLRQMLIMFRDLAGTKEIITNSKSNLIVVYRLSLFQNRVIHRNPTQITIPILPIRTQAHLEG